MSKIVWDKTGERLYETGVKNGVLYLQTNGVYNNGVAWNGLTAVTESPSGAEATALYADDMKYLNLYSAEEFGATIEAYTYPDEFAECDGSKEIVDGVVIGQQTRKVFGLCYRTVIVMTPMAKRMVTSSISFMVLWRLRLKRLMPPSMIARKQLLSLGKSPRLRLM